MPYAIRDSKPDDFEALWKLDQECFPPGIAYSKVELRAYMRHRGAFTVVGADDAGRIGGFLVAHGGPVGHIITIDVAEPARRAGLGSLLLNAAEEQLKSVGARAVGLEVAVDNAGAISFYKRHGYGVYRTWPRYYSNGVDALGMTKGLL